MDDGGRREGEGRECQQVRVISIVPAVSRSSPGADEQEQTAGKVGDDESSESDGQTPRKGLKQGNMDKEVRCIPKEKAEYEKEVAV